MGNPNINSGGKSNFQPSTNLYNFGQKFDIYVYLSDSARFLFIYLFLYVLLCIILFIIFWDVFLIYLIFLFYFFKISRNHRIFIFLLYFTNLIFR